MTRRLFLALPTIAAASDVPDTPRNRVCLAANDFHSQYLIWATRMNEHIETVNASAVEAFGELPELWRKVEHAHRTWIRGY